MGAPRRRNAETKAELPEPRPFPVDSHGEGQRSLDIMRMAEGDDVFPELTAMATMPLGKHSPRGFLREVDCAGTVFKVLPLYLTGLDGLSECVFRRSMRVPKAGEGAIGIGATQSGAISFIKFTSVAGSKLVGEQMAPRDFEAVARLGADYFSISQLYERNLGEYARAMGLSEGDDVKRILRERRSRRERYGR